MIYTIAACVGATLSERNALDSLSYDGKIIATYLMKDRPFQDGEILHEICHYVAATSEERHLPEFGMVARPSIGLSQSRLPAGQWTEYQERTPTPVIEKPQRHIRECATQYLHQG